MHDHASVRGMPSKPVSLRERHRRETRRRIAEAACELAIEHGIENLRAEAIAQRADISRRTFFNYVATTEAAFRIPFEDFLERARANMLEQPSDLPLLDAISSALTSAVEPEYVAQLARMCEIASGSDVFARYQLEAWEQGERGVCEILAARMPPGTDSLYVATLAASIAGAGRAGVAAWAAAQAKRRRKLSAKRRVAEFVSFLVKALGYLGATPRLLEVVPKH